MSNIQNSVKVLHSEYGLNIIRYLIMQWFVLSNEVHDDEMEEEVGKDEVTKGSLWADSTEEELVLRINLDPKTDWNQQKSRMRN